MSDPTAIIIENGESVPTQLPIPTEKQTRRTKRKVLPKLLRVAGQIPFAEDVAAAYYCAVDSETPRKAKLVLFAALGYFVLPIDAVPDVLAGLGFSDDAAVLTTAIGVVGMHIKPTHRYAAQRLLRLPNRSTPPADRN
ncbi:MAG: YkvA family protein [Henriciella sp.]|nr:YkvA family protein [Henriciella sp.]